MSDVCGRRRLAKLAFITGVSRSLRVFLEEVKDIDNSSDWRLAGPFVSHAAFLQVPSENDNAIEIASGGSLHSGFLQSQPPNLPGFISFAQLCQFLAELLELQKAGIQGGIPDAAEWFMLELFKSWGGDTNGNPLGPSLLKEGLNGMVGAAKDEEKLNVIVKWGQSLEQREKAQCPETPSGFPDLVQEFDLFKQSIGLPSKAVYARRHDYQEELDRMIEPRAPPIDTRSGPIATQQLGSTQQLGPTQQLGSR